MRISALPVFIATLWMMILMFGVPATSNASVTQRDLARFLRTHPQPEDYTQSINPIIVILKTTGRDHGPSAAAVRLANDWRIPSPVAQALIELVVLPDWEIANRATRKQRAADVRLVLDQADDSQRAWAVILHYADAQNRCADRQLEERYFRHPWASSAFLHEAEFVCMSWLFDIPRYAAPTPLLYGRIADSLSVGTDGTDVDALVAARALRDSLAQERMRVNASAYLYALRVYWLELADLGMTDELLAEADSLPRGDLSLILDGKAAGDVVVDGFPLEEADYARREAAALQEAWIIALLEAKRSDEARTWLVRWGWSALLGKPPDSLASRSIWATDLGLDPRGVIAHLVLDGNDVDIFDTFIGSKQLSLTPLDSPTGRRLAIAYVSAHGYPEFAEYLRSQRCAPYGNAAGVSWSNFPRSFQAMRENLESHVPQVTNSDSDCNPGRMASADDSLRRKKEYRLPPALRWTGPRGAARIPVQARASLGGFSIVRYSASENLAAAISLSQVADPTGEVSGGGYWLHLSRDGGKTWGKPIYLGLQQYEPYDVVTESHLPLLAGGKLQIEVEVKEVDPSKVMFPPVALRAERTARDLYIELPLDELERDSDGDGLTDLLEERLHTNPFDADTDHDGLSDALDPLPQVSNMGPPVADSDVLRLALRTIFGYDSAAIPTGGPRDPANAPSTLQDLLTAAAVPRGKLRTVLFLEGQKNLFRGLTLPNTTIILSEAEVRQDERRYGLFYPVLFQLWFNHARTRAYLLWSATWTGGTLTFTKKEGHWQKPETSGWIT